MLAVHLTAALSLTPITATTVAHALELPGKARLSREEYAVVQRIYYPGFTVVGALEPPALVALAASAVRTPRGDPARPWRWTAAGLAAAAHVVYWAVVHPANRQWLAGEPSVGAAARTFFALRAADRDRQLQRRRWERGHLARCALTTAATISVIVGLTFERA